MSLRVEAITGEDLKVHLGDVARLRIEVFRDYPYLYDGDLDYEARYLHALASSPKAVMVGAFDGEHLVGVATGAPLFEQAAEITLPFRQRGLDVDRYFYFGESVLKSGYRGYAPVEGLACEISWKELGEAGETPKRMQFWQRTLAS
ncbi:MAG: GNAT family N-acetyltransferase [Micropepsaceae bacterium]